MALLYYFLGAHYYNDLNRCAPALPLLERSLVWLEKAHGPDAYGPTEMGDRLGRCLLERGRYADAERFLKRAISIGERMPDAANGGRRRDFRPMLGSLYEAQGHSDAAKALAAPAGPSVPMPPWRATPAITQAHAHAAQGRYAEAEALYRQELARLQDADSFAPTKAAIAALQDKLDELTGWSAEKQKARQSLITELMHMRGTLPTEEQIAAVRDALGALYDKQGRHAEAEALYRQELARLEAAFNPATKAAVDAMQEKWKEMNRSPQAPLEERKALARESWRLSQTLTTEDQLARALHVLGRHCHQRGKYAEAEAYLKRTIGLHEHLDYAEQISIQLSLARLRTDQQRYSDAESAYKHVLAVYEKRDQQHARGSLPKPPTASVLKSLAALALKQGQPDRAEELHKSALRVLEDLGPDRFDVARMLNDLAEFYREQKRYAEAEPLLKRALAIYMKGDMSPNHGPVRTALASLAAVFTGQGRNADVERLMRGTFEPVRP
jgi:tetratricopeptide (TPR) repeat protein